MGKKNKRIADRLAAVGKDVADVAERADATAALQGAAAEDLFVLDVPTKKRKRPDAVGAASSSTASKRAKEDAASAAASTDALVADALAAVEKASKVKVLVAKPKKEVPLTLEQERHLRKVAARMAAVDPAAEEERRLLKQAAGGVAKTADRRGGYTLKDVWAEESGSAGAGAGAGAVAAAPARKLTSSKPKAVGVLAAVPAPGTSYNPSLEDHQEAVAQAVAEEAAEEARRQLLLEKTMGADRRGKTASVPGHDRKARSLLKHGASVGIVDPGWEEEAQAAVEQYMQQLDKHDNDEDEDEEGADAGKGAGAGAGAGAASSLSASAAGGSAAGAGAGQAAAAGGKGKGKAAKGPKRDEVADALAALQAEEVARAARRATKAASKSGHSSLVKAGLALPHATALRTAGTTLTAVPLSSELTGSLRTMKALPAGAVVLDAMIGLAARGDTTARRVNHTPFREDLATGTLLPVPMGTLRRAKKIGNPYKELEFPRRKEFEPAAAAAKEAEATRQAAKVAKAREDAARGAARKKARAEAAAAIGLEMPE